MDDPFKRGWLTFVGLSLGFFFIAQAMTANGTAARSNPVWQFVSFVQRIFIWAWVLLLAVAAIAYLAIAISAIFDAIRERESTRLNAEHLCAMQIANEKIRAEETLKRKREEKQAKEKVLVRELQHRMTIDQEMERRRRRSTEQAINEALDDF